MNNKKKKPDYDKMFKQIRARLQEVIQSDFVRCSDCGDFMNIGTAKVFGSDKMCTECALPYVTDEYESDSFKKDMSDPEMCDGELGVYSVEYVKSLETMNRTLEAQVDSLQKKVGK